MPTVAFLEKPKPTSEEATNFINSISPETLLSKQELASFDKKIANQGYDGKYRSRKDVNGVYHRISIYEERQNKEQYFSWKYRPGTNQTGFTLHSPDSIYLTVQKFPEEANQNFFRIFFKNKGVNYGDSEIVERLYGKRKNAQVLEYVDVKKNLDNPGQITLKHSDGNTKIYFKENIRNKQYPGIFNNPQFDANSDGYMLLPGALTQFWKAK